MKLRQFLITALLLAGVETATFGFDHCEADSKNAGEIVGQLHKTILQQAPVQYHEISQSIKLITNPPAPSLIPFAAIQQGTRIVVFPPQFVRLVCNMAITSYLINKGVSGEVGTRVAQAAAECFSKGGSEGTCLAKFGDDLATGYARPFAELPRGDQQEAYFFYRCALRHIMTHEYAHQYLGHLTGSSLARIDQEFEADLFAILNAVQAGDVPTGMAYFFDPMRQIEKYAQGLFSENYESAACRLLNVDNITGFFGFGPGELIDAAYGGNLLMETNSPAKMHRIYKEQFGGKLPTLDTGSCARIAKAALPAGYAELKQLYSRMDQDADFLFYKGKNFDTARASELVRDLAGMTSRFHYMQAIAAGALALVLRQWGLAGRDLTPLTGQIDRLMDTKAVTDNFQSQDFGRLLQAQGLAVVQERTDLPAQTRLTKADALLQRAVLYNSAQTESWMNLAMIAWQRRDCSKAADYIVKALLTFSVSENPPEARDSLNKLANKMKSAAADPKTCAAETANEHIYPGL